MKIELKTPDQIAIMAEGGRRLSLIRDELVRRAQPGLTTLEIDSMAEELIRSGGDQPSFKGYGGFPYTICANLNQIVVHGFPNKRALLPGDLFSLDIGLIHRGFHIDTTATTIVGGLEAASPQVQKFYRTGQQALDLAISQALVGNRVGDISHAMQSTVEAAGFSVIREYVGHGVGTSLHMDPQIPCYGKPHTGPELVEGMTLAIEIMMNMGQPQVKDLKDGWQVVTKDGTLSAQFEHTIALTSSGPQVLTQSQP